MMVHIVHMGVGCECLSYSHFSAHGSNITQENITTDKYPIRAYRHIHYDLYDFRQRGQTHTQLNCVNYSNTIRWPRQTKRTSSAVYLLKNKEMHKHIETSIIEKTLITRQSDPSYTFQALPTYRWPNLTNPRRKFQQLSLATRCSKIILIFPRKYIRTHWRTRHRNKPSQPLK